MLAQHPDRFEVTVLDRAPHPGGQATSITLDETKYGASWLNDGVQGGSPIFRHTFNFFRRYGYHVQEIKLQVSFGKGRDNFWTNVFPSPLVDEFSGEIKKLGKVLKRIKRLMPILGLLPIKTILRLFRFSPEFGNKMVLPMMALFLGTGNQTPHVSSVLLERLFNDRTMKLWDYDPVTLLPNLPTMFTFPNMSNFYRDWMADLRSKGVIFRLRTHAKKILRRDRKGVVIQIVGEDSASRLGDGKEPNPEIFDELVLCIPADEAKMLLGRTTTWSERFVLGGARFYDDVTVIHSDSEYFRRTYETRFKGDLCAEFRSQERKDQVAFAKNTPRSQKDGWTGFQPMFYTHPYPTDPSKLEVAFDCSNYQHQFRNNLGEGRTPLKHDRHIFHSIFRNEEEKHLWSIDQIDADKIISRKRWHQLGHRWQHSVRVIPGMMFINGRNRTLFAGGWTFLNMHEVACVSGIAAAYRLGATYEHFDDFAEGFFSKYLLLSHGMRYKRRDRSKYG
ncbi:hypothetical protein VTN00DRAFT_8690 [Thermoascus crustaceus]|uniref:uncharacterized protein n=1 Tax=Thermoascus crustaceus TaxID=5088 RepID=UPI0037443A54